MPARFSAVRSASVLIPTFQGGEFLDRVLEGLAGQRGGELAWDLLVIDSGSSDGTLEILKRWRGDFPVPMRVRGIDPVEFDHGDTRNQLAAWSTGELLVFLTQDAIPGSEDWLATLVQGFEDPEVAAATCRNVPRPDASFATRLFSRDDPGYAEEGRLVRLPDDYDALDPHARRLLYNFNDVASAFRREVWRRHPFPRTPFGEDVLMARALLEAGYVLRYDADALVEHSHEYGPDEVRARAVVDGRFNAEWLDRTCIASAADARTLTERFAASDAETVREAGISGDAARSLERELSLLRKSAFEGLHEGGLTERRRRATAVLERENLHVLYVVHGFPPETWAGTEVYTQNLATEMQRRGHRCTILTRSPGEEGGAPDFTVTEDDLEGLRVLRMTNRLQHRRLADSYRDARAEEAFRAVLERERPDLVHFQHLIHTSAGLVGVAKDAGLPTVVHCHDYWSLCARVQLIRPDGVRCEENMGLGCLYCVKDRDLGSIPAKKKLGESLGGLLDLGARAARKGLFGRARVDSAGAYLDMRERGPFVLSAYASADLVVSPSRFLRSKLLASGAFESEKFLYSDNGMRTDHVQALETKPDPEGRLRLGFVGSLVWYKGGEVLVRAMRRLEDAPITLSFFGDFRPDEDTHHAQLRELAPESVRFRGRFDNARLSEVYSEIDVLVVPSTWFENSPITIHEAFMTGTPVVASDIGGMAEYVEDGVDGLLFPTGDDEALARTLRRFADEPDLLERLGRNFMTIKTIEEDAALTEARYRALCARVSTGAGAR